jgi:lysophospholipase L1-like esterase
MCAAELRISWRHVRLAAFGGRAKFMHKPNDLVTVVFMGDSITEGQYVAPPDRWVDIVSPDITRSYLQSPTTVLFLTKGVSGETTRQGLERFPRDVQSHYPDIVTLQFGLNDCNCWATDHGLPRVSPAAFRANIVEMIERCRHFGAEQIILSNNHTTLRHKQLLSGRSLERLRKEYNQIAVEVAAETDALFCDIDAAFAGLGAAELERMLLAYPDWLHLSQGGHERYARTILPFVRSAVAEVVQSRSARSAQIAVAS